MTTSIEAMPDYERPPLVETVVGVQFDQLQSFTNAHLGGFWKSLDATEWPTTADAPPLPRQVEEFTEGAKWAKGLRLQFTQDPACRIQIKNADEDRMVQLQNNRLHFNWLGASGGNYPRYGQVLAEFKQILASFVRFVSDENLGEFRPNQWELTYVNHIPKGSVWETPADWNFFEPLAAIPSVDKVVQGESFSGEWHFTIPDQRGRLHIEWKHGVKPKEGTDEQQFVRLTLTARGKVEENSIDGIVEGLDLGHKTIVSSFSSLMSNNANKYWGQK
ncbi:TIGR04255 family protein [Aeoliella sp. ICT_H6.2]|uniref:TIGR04255 family protein n=1 Tax=Aeoliella straminimaris TaxID=2954799 RepID=A0A9X2F7J7_9BACT|nr:TIGR04255 family protein [Aeoliella straminimaris]MCO6043299.1 TIGR04255 family protein [Aeoliella straminimaris]